MPEVCHYCKHSGCDTPGDPVVKVRSLVDEPGFEVKQGDEFYVCHEDLVESLSENPPAVEVI